MESQIMEWSQGMGKRLKEYFRSRESRRRMTGEWDAAISVGATLFMVTVRNGRFLKEKEYILSGEGEASFAEALCRAEKDGFRHRKLLWLMNEPDLRCVCRKFPNMTEPELEETIQWEEDRLFGSEPVQSGYHILSYTPEGYEVLVSAIRKETGDRLAAAAEKAGRVIAWGISPPDLFRIRAGDRPWILVLGGASRGQVFAAGAENAWRSKQLRLQEDTAQRQMEARAVSSEGRVFFFPMTDGDKAGKLWCQAMEEAGLSVTEPLSLPGEALWKPQVMEAAPYMPACSINLARRRTAFLRRAPAGERTGYLPARLHSLWMVLSLSCCLYEAVSLWKAEKVMKEMAPVAAAHAKWEKEKEWEKALAEDLNVWEKGSGHWQKRLIYLSEAAGTNVVLSSLEGQNGEIRIQGTAMTDEEARAFADLLGAAWGGQVRWEKSRREKTAAHVIFSGVQGKGEPWYDKSVGRWAKSLISAQAGLVLMALLFLCMTFCLGQLQSRMEAETLRLTQEAENLRQWKAEKWNLWIFDYQWAKSEKRMPFMGLRRPVCISCPGKNRRKKKKIQGK